MNLEQALAAIKAAENGEALVAIVEAEIEKLKTKNFVVLGEKKKAQEKSKAYFDALEAIRQRSGVEGELNEVLDKLAEKVETMGASLTALEAEKVTLAARNSELEGKVSAFEVEGKISKIAKLSNGSEPVIAQLFKGDLDKFTLPEKEEDKLLFQGKEFTPEVLAESAFKDFVPSIFPVQPKESTKKKLGGTPPGNPENKTPPVVAVLNKRYSFPGSK